MAMFLQMSADAAKSSSTIFLDGAAVMALIVAGGLTVREFAKTRKVKRNGNGKGPGQAEVCIVRGQRLAVLDECLKNTKEDIVEIKVDVKEILRRLPSSRGN